MTTPVLVNCTCLNCGFNNHIDTQSPDWLSAAGWIECEVCHTIFHTDPNSQTDIADPHTAYNHLCPRCLLDWDY